MTIDGWPEYNPNCSVLNMSFEEALETGVCNGAYLKTRQDENDTHGLRLASEDFDDNIDYLTVGQVRANLTLHVGSESIELGTFDCFQDALACAIKTRPFLTQPSLE